MADSDLVVTALAATTGGLGTIIVNWTFGGATNPLPYLALDHFEVWSATSNDRSLATKAADSVDFKYQVSGLGYSVSRWFWVRAIDVSGNIGDWFPTGVTSGVQGTTHATIGASDISSVPTSLLTGQIVTAQIATAAITANELASAAVTNIKIAATAVATANLQLAAVDSTILANSSVIAAAIATGAVITAKLGAAAVVTAALALAAVDSTIIANGAVVTAGLNSLAVTAAKVANATLTGTQIAAATIAAGNIVSGTITTTQIASATIVAGNIASGTITATQITSGTITTTQIASGTIVTGNIASATIIAGNIASATITSTQLATSSVTTTQLAAGAVTAAKITAGTITSNEIAAATITGDRMVASTITARELILTDYRNLVPDGNFDSGTYVNHWSVGGVGSGNALVMSSAVANVATGQFALLIDKSATLTNSATANSLDFIPVTAGAQYWVEALIRAGSATSAGFYIVINWYQADGTVSATPTTNAIVNQPFTLGFTSYGTRVTVPSDASQCKLHVYNHSTQTTVRFLIVDHVVMRLADGASLVVDGTITGTAIAALTITAANLGANTITAAKITAGTITATQIHAHGVNDLQQANFSPPGGTLAMNGNVGGAFVVTLCSKSVTVTDYPITIGGWCDFVTPGGTGSTPTYWVTLEFSGASLGQPAIATSETVVLVAGTNYVFQVGGVLLPPNGTYTVVLRIHYGVISSRNSLYTINDAHIGVIIPIT